MAPHSGERNVYAIHEHCCVTDVLETFAVGGEQTRQNGKLLLVLQGQGFVGRTDPKLNPNFLSNSPF
jgi:hypothetical protein